MRKPPNRYGPHPIWAFAKCSAPGRIGRDSPSATAFHEGDVVVGDRPPVKAACSYGTISSATMSCRPNAPSATIAFAPDRPPAARDSPETAGRDGASIAPTPRYLPGIRWQRRETDAVRSSPFGAERCDVVGNRSASSATSARPERPDDGARNATPRYPAVAATGRMACACIRCPRSPTLRGACRSAIRARSAVSPPLISWSSMCAAGNRRRACAPHLPQSGCVHDRSGAVRTAFAPRIMLDSPEKAICRRRLGTQYQYSQAQCCWCSPSLPTTPTTHPRLRRFHRPRQRGMILAPIGKRWPSCVAPRRAWPCRHRAAPSARGEITPSPPCCLDGGVCGDAGAAAYDAHFIAATGSATGSIPRWCSTWRVPEQCRRFPPGISDRIWSARLVLRSRPAASESIVLPPLFSIAVTVPLSCWLIRSGSTRARPIDSRTRAAHSRRAWQTPPHRDTPNHRRHAHRPRTAIALPV